MATKKQGKTTATKAAPTARVAAPGATATHRTIVAVVSDATKDAAELALASFDAVNGTAFSGAFLPWYGGWDGISEPAPSPMFWLQSYQFNNLSQAALYEQAMTSLTLVGVRWYEAIVVPFEVGNPANSVDSIYTSGYDGELPVREPFAGACAWFLDVVGALPPREQMPTS